MDCVQYRILNPQQGYNCMDQLHDYFQLEVSLSELYNDWCVPCDNISATIRRLPGMRVARQCPFECMISFICSANNNIVRITKMLNELRTRYGTLLYQNGDDTFYSFPTIQELQAADEKTLRELGFGYRARYIAATVAELEKKGGEQYLASLRKLQNRNDVRVALCTFPGVGPKVADCISLFSLNQNNVVPVDTHVWQIACRDLDPTLNGKSLTTKVYNRVGDLFRERFENYAGWAHSVLFAAELPQFRHDISPREITKSRKRKSKE